MTAENKCTECNGSGEVEKNIMRGEEGMQVEMDVMVKCECSNLQDDINFIVSRYPDAYAKKWASLSIFIYCPLLDRRLSGIFHTEEEAWGSAVEWQIKKEVQRTTTLTNTKK